METKEIGRESDFMCEVKFSLRSQELWEFITLSY